MSFFSAKFWQTLFWSKNNFSVFVAPATPMTALKDGGHVSTGRPAKVKM
jgi:hypothetical protein